MNIGIDVQSTMGSSTGIGYYTKQIVERLNSHKDIDLSLFSPNNDSDFSTLQRISWENIGLKFKARKENLDILHIPGFAGPVFNGKYKKITTVHDLIGMVYPQNLGFVSRFYWQRWLPFCVKNSDFIIADSENTKKDIVQFLNVPENKIRVIYLAAGLSFIKFHENSSKRELLNEVYNITSKYILNVGTIEPRKNIVRLIEAFDLYIKETADKELNLVIAGKKGWDYEKCHRKVVELDLAEKVIFCDYVSDEHLPILYNYAEALVYPSFYEGFGLPVLESMSCGTPVICSKVSSLPEICGESALYVDPKNVNSIKDALIEMFSDYNIRESLSVKALKQASKFSWDKTIQNTIEVYKKVLNEA